MPLSASPLCPSLFSRLRLSFAYTLQVASLLSCLTLLTNARLDVGVALTGGYYEASVPSLTVAKLLHHRFAQNCTCHN